MSTVSESVAAGQIAGCLWLYSNYHCNMSCEYCLTESSPGATRRLLGSERMLELTAEAAELGFTSVGVGGGEPFLIKEMPELLAQLAQILPVVVLTNGSLFTPALLQRMRPLAELPVALQVSLDSADAETNDRYRGAGNFEAVITAIPRLLELGITVRLATTGEDGGPDPELCALHRRLGISEEDHIVRPVIRRGRAASLGLGVEGSVESLPPELTITCDGAFWSPFAPTVHNDRLDTDLLISRAVAPLSKPVDMLLGLIQGRPTGGDVSLNIR